ncbi:hypothetical protein [Gimesia sp.]|uniref:hypothetical protein n=1 Tax=Gimesia sp. TaxID=2024833 RepID=UPI003A8EDE55
MRVGLIQDDIRNDLAQRFDHSGRFRDLKRNQQILKAAKKHRMPIAAGKHVVFQMDLEVQIEQLEARLKSVQAAETVSNLQIDNSQLTQAKV